MFATMLLITGVVASTAIRIEWYNHAVGGFLPRPQPPSMEGNDVKWRASGPHMAEWHYRSRVAWDQGLELDLVEDKEALFALPLSEGQQNELAGIKHGAALNARFRHLVETMGCMQYLLVPIGLILSVGTLRANKLWLRCSGISCLVINLAAGGLMFYRGYFQSLGW